LGWLHIVSVVDGLRESGQGAYGVCLGGCGVAGTCVDGVCHCPVGSFGPACSERRAPLLLGGGAKRAWLRLQAAVSEVEEKEAEVEAKIVSEKKKREEKIAHEKALAEKKRAEIAREKALAEEKRREEKIAHEKALAEKKKKEREEQKREAALALEELRHLDDGGEWSNSSSCASRGCSGHGRCLSSGCSCATGWSGPFCDQELCPEDCSGRGHCLVGSCLCEAAFFGRACEHVRCPNDCSGNGYCFQGRCQCSGRWGGVSCETELYPGGIVLISMPRRSKGSVAEPWAGAGPVGKVNTLRSSADAHLSN